MEIVNILQLNKRCRTNLGWSKYYKLQNQFIQGGEERKRNEINLDLNWLSSLKTHDDTSINLINPNDIFSKTSESINYEFISDDNYNYKSVEIVGNPSLSRLQYFIIGIENSANYPISGEIWADELRLSGVKESGSAVRIKSKFNLSDFSSSSINYNKKSRFPCFARGWYE